MIDKYIELYKDGGYIREMRKYVGHAPILTCACGVIIVNDRGEILLQKRRDNGCWAIIGGAMEMGETFEETVRRETREESGLLLGKLELFQLYSGRDRIIEYPNGDVCFGPGIVFITSEYEGTIVNDPEEVLEHRFFKRSELPENLNQYDKDIILEWAGRNNMFESKYAKCEYVEKDRAVLHVWKKEAHYDDYRKPVKASLEMLKNHAGSVFIVDARNGFEDVKEDVEWGFSYFLPELKKTGCKIWGFILPKVSDIEGEIDLWTQEIEKNFTVIRGESYADVLEKVLHEQNYIKWIRSKVGHEKIMLTFAGGCIFNEKGEVLLQRRGDSDLWGFPGGAIELGETPQMAAIREAKEETGLDVTVGRVIGVYTDLDIRYSSGDRAQSIVIAYELKPVGGELFCNQVETKELKYFSKNDKPELFTKSHEDLWKDVFGI